MPLISVVIACCDVEPWLRDCAESLLRQTFADFDAVFYVEDSKDGTEALARELAACDPRFSVVTGPRSGSASAARNWAIHCARGEYIWMFDGDDGFPEGAMLEWARLVRETHPDAALGVRRVFAEEADGHLSPRADQPPPGGAGVWASGMAYVLEAKVFENVFWPALTRCLFRRQAAEALGFDVPQGRRHQDSGWLYRLLLNAGPVATTMAPVCDYRRRAGSVTMTPNPKSMLDNADNCFDALEYAAALPEGDPRLPPLGVYIRKKLFHGHPMGMVFGGGRFPVHYGAPVCRQAWTRIFRTEAARRGYVRMLAGATPGQRLEFALMRLAQCRGCFHVTRAVLRMLLCAKGLRFEWGGVRG